MSAHKKAYRFRMRPTAEQEQFLNRMAGARRWVWNWALNRRREHYRTFKRTLSYNALAAELTALKTRVETAWLNDIDSQALQQAIMDVCQAFVNFFEKRARFPRFKSRKRDRCRFRIPQRVKVIEGIVVVPKIGNVLIYQSQPVDLPTKSATFKRDAKGHWFVTLIADFAMPDVALPPPDHAKVVGIDLGLIDYATLSDGTEPIPAPKFYRKRQRKLKRAQRAFSRRKKGSKRRAKAHHAVACVQQRTANQRKDFLHKLTTALVLDHDGLCIEDLSVRGLARTKLAKSMHDASLGEFRRQVEYKGSWNRTHVVAVDRFFPSSKMCCKCRVLNHDLTLSDREWDCGCGAHHKRDFNAAVNIRDEGLRMLAVGYTDSLNAQGDTVRPGTSGLVSLN
jgi:putative transposase